MSYQEVFQKQSRKQLELLELITTNFVTSLNKFLSQDEIKLLILPHSWSGQLAAMKVLWALQNLTGELAASYGTPGTYMFIKWGDLFESLNDLNPDVSPLMNILVIELDDVNKGMNCLTSIVRRVHELDGKKIVFAWSTCVNERFDVFLDMFNTFLIYKMNTMGNIDAKDILRTRKDERNRNWFRAVNSSDIERMKDIYAQNFDIINEKEIDMQETALHMAVSRGDLNMVRMLLERGASHVLNKNNLAPLHLAVKKGDVGVIRALLGNRDVDRNMKGGKKDYTPLHYAVFRNNAMAISLLAEHGADLNKPSSYGFTPLHFACQKGYTESVESLLSYKERLDINFAVGFGRNETPLHSAVLGNYPKIISLLVNHGADVNKPSSSGFTPLHLACQKGNIESVERLLSYKGRVNINFLAGFGRNETPLHTAVGQGSLKIIEMLICHGASTSIKDGNHRTPLELAEHNEKYEILYILNKKRARV